MLPVRYVFFDLKLRLVFGAFIIGEKVLRRYKNPDPDGNDCDLSNETDPKKMGFWFCDLIPG